MLNRTDQTQDGVEQDQAAQGQHSLPPAVGSAFIPAPLLGSGKFLSHDLPGVDCGKDPPVYRISVDMGDSA